SSKAREPWPIVSQTRCPANDTAHTSGSPLTKRQLGGTSVFNSSFLCPPLYSLQSRGDETPKLFATSDYSGSVDHSCHALRGVHCRRHWANFNCHALATTCRLRSSLGRKDSHARQGGTERDIVFAQNTGWLVTQDAGHLHTHSLYFPHLSSPRR